MSKLLNKVISRLLNLKNNDLNIKQDEDIINYFTDYFNGDKL